MRIRVCQGFALEEEQQLQRGQKQVVIVGFDIGGFSFSSLVLDEAAARQNRAQPQSVPYSDGMGYDRQQK